MTFETIDQLPIAHMVYFKLADRSSQTLAVFLKTCSRYLAGHVGQTHFSLAVRAFDMARDVNDRDFDVAMNMIFSSKASYDLYRKDPRHEEFITESCGLSIARRVFDSYIVK